MSAELRERLQSTLAGAYTLERELGGGGMSRVFLAHDTGAGDPCPVVVTGGIRYGWEVRAL